MTDTLTILEGDCVEQLRTLPDESVQCVVTSPPYYGLRDYKITGQIGLEPSPDEYVKKLVACFQEVRRVLKSDGTVWLNLGDSYNCSVKGGNPSDSQHNKQQSNRGSEELVRSKRIGQGSGRWGMGNNCVPGLKPKDLIGIPWRVAFALQADVWWLRSDIIWNKPNPMPESVTDRPTRAHEYIFLMTKSAKYFYDYEAIKETPSPEFIQQIEEGYNGQAVKDYLGMGVQDASKTKARIINGYRNRIDKQRGHSRRHAGFNDKWDALTPAEQALCGRNKRSVWTVAPANFRGAHFATFPIELIKPCLLAGSKANDVVLDPFGGSGTTAFAALELGRKAVTIELNPDYVKLIKQRCAKAQPPLIAA